MAAVVTLAGDALGPAVREIVAGSAAIAGAVATVRSSAVSKGGQLLGPLAVSVQSRPVESLAGLLLLFGILIQQSDHHITTPPPPLATPPQGLNLSPELKCKRIKGSLSSGHVVLDLETPAHVCGVLVFNSAGRYDGSGELVRGGCKRITIETSLDGRSWHYAHR